MTQHFTARWKRAFFLLAGGVALVSVAYVTHKATAAGVPTTTPLFYSGYLEDGNGAPLPGPTRQIQVTLYDSATTGEGTPVCVTPFAPTPVNRGRFRVALVDACVEAIAKNPDLYVELTVDTTTLARSKLGAVPYALNAGRTVVKKNGKEHSLGGTYCGVTPPTTGGLGDTGYAAAKTLCEAQSACGSPSAHVCTPPEVVMSISMSISLPAVQGWINDSQVVGNSADCLSWSDATTTYSAKTFDNTSVPARFVASNCSEMRPFICCD